MMLKNGDSNIELLHLVEISCCFKAWWTVTQGKNKKKKGVGEKENWERERKGKEGQTPPIL